MFSLNYGQNAVVLIMLYAQSFFQRIRLYDLTEQLTFQLKKVLLLRERKKAMLYLECKICSFLFVF